MLIQWTESRARIAYVTAITTVAAIAFVTATQPAEARWGETSSARATPTAADQTSAVYKKDNVTFDLSNVHDRNLRLQITTALDLGYRQMALGKKNVKTQINGLRGNGQARTIRFYSDENEANPNAIRIGAPAFATWNGPQGAGDMLSLPQARTDLRIFLRPGQPYWYLVSNVWHELLHIVLSTTHRQITPEGEMPERYVNDSIWYPTIKRVMLDFPMYAPDPVTGESVELYNPENNPWS